MEYELNVVSDPICPRCRSENVGGAVVNDMVPDWQCIDCNHTWPRLLRKSRG